MKSLKKNKDIIFLLVTFLFTILIFATMAGAAFTLSGTVGPGQGAELDLTLYEVLTEYEDNGVTVTAFVFMILTLVGTLATLVLNILNIKVPAIKVIYIALGVFALIGGLLFFLTKTQIDGDLIKALEFAKIKVSLGVGSIFSGIFGIVSGVSLLGAAIVK